MCIRDRVSSYGGCSETCQPWQGRIYVDDVYSGGTAAEAQALKLPLLSEAIAGGLFHPNCRHRLTTWFPGMDDSTAIKGHENPPALKEHNKNRRMIQRTKRIVAGALDPQTVATAKYQQGKWTRADEQLIANNPDLLCLLYTSDTAVLKNSLSRMAYKEGSTECSLCLLYTSYVGM